MTERFTLLRGLKWAGVICGLIGSGLLAATALGVTWGCESASAEKQRQATLAVCASATFFLVVGIWLYALAVRTAVIAGQRSLFVRSLFSQQTITWHEISRARWSGFSINLTLFWPGGRRKVSLANSADSQGRELLRILRFRIDQKVQEGWNEHHERLLKSPRVFTRTQHDAMIRSMYRGVLLCGIPGGVVIALGLAALAQLPAAAYRELAIRGALFGLVATLVPLMLITLLDRFSRPEEPHTSD
ncbi:MAG: hypothetical protein KDA79_17700 [Planctomycetaceae bacterium]|nr:hypothetical protein [Planctomycetaceae bacterium]